MLTGLILAAALAATAALIATAIAATTENLKVVRKKEDSFRNYDFTERTISRTKVDWPVDFLFYNNAEIDRVKDKMSGFMPHTGSTQYARVNNGAGGVWDEDKGIKDSRCPNPVVGENQRAYHLRLYAPPSTDRLYNRKWGYYIIGTSHIDHRECFTDRWYGKSEEAEGHIALYAEDVFGPDRVKRNHRGFGNREPFREEKDHIWLNNGEATFVKVP
jgi:hypothetical protein